MDLYLNGKTAVVTGSTAGIGEAIATTLCAEGARVVVHGRRSSELDRVVATIRAAGGDAVPCAADIRSAGELDLLVAVARAAFGTIDILVNNAGTYDLESTWQRLSPDDWMERYNEHVVSAVRLVRHFLPAMKAQGWGRIINMSSTSANAPTVELPEYAASKAALANLTVSFARDCEGTHVTANAITPGTILTEGIHSYIRKVAAERGWVGDDDAIAQRALVELFDNPRCGWGYARDVAYVAAMLASPRADWINGANFRVDGGSTGVVQ